MRTLFLSGQGRAMGSAAAQLIPASFQLPLKPCPLCPFRRVLGKCSSAIAPTCHHKLHYHLHGNVRKDMEALICTYRQGLSHRPYDPHDLSRSQNSSKGLNRHCLPLRFFYVVLFMLLKHAAANYQV